MHMISRCTGRVHSKWISGPRRVHATVGTCHWCPSLSIPLWHLIMFLSGCSKPLTHSKPLIRPTFSYLLRRNSTNNRTGKNSSLPDSYPNFQAQHPSLLAPNTLSLRVHITLCLHFIYETYSYFLAFQLLTFTSIISLVDNPKTIKFYNIYFLVFQLHSFL